MCQALSRAQGHGCEQIKVPVIPQRATFQNPEGWKVTTIKIIHITENMKVLEMKPVPMETVWSLSHI